jgi:hypothetical protein
MPAAVENFAVVGEFSAAISMAIQESIAHTMRKL